MKCLPILHSHLPFLQNTIHTTAEEIKIKTRFTVQPDSPKAEESRLLIELLAAISSGIGDTRFMLFYKMNDQQIVADIAIDKAIFYCIIKPYQRRQ